MAYINKKDTNGTKGLLQQGELGYDAYPAGGDEGRIYVGTGSANIAIAQKQEVDDVVSGTTNIIIDNTVSGLAATTLKDAVDEIITGDISLSGVKTFEGDVVLNANLYVNGTTTQVNSTEVTTADNIIVLNDGEVGSGVTAGESGIYVDRGLLTNYGIVFDETDDSFKVGELGALQKVATREDAPTDAGFAYWDAASFKFVTTTSPEFASVTIGGVNVLTEAEVTAKDDLVRAEAYAAAIALG